MYTPEKEYNLYEILQKADNGDLEAMETAVSLLAAEGYINDDQNEEIAERQVLYLRQLAEAGRANAFIMLGDACLKGKGTAKDAKEAIQWYEKAAENGISFGNECIGMLYFNGTEIPADYKKAYEYLTKEEGDKSFCTIYALGEMFRRGLHVPQDDEKACALYALIVNDNRPYAEIDDYYWQACFRLATAYHYGLGVERSLDRAVELMAKAKNLYETRGDEVAAGDITREEFYREWLMLNQDAGAF